MNLTSGRTGNVRVVFVKSVFVACCTQHRSTLSVRFFVWRVSKYVLTENSMGAGGRGGCIRRTEREMKAHEIEKTMT